MAMGPTKDRAQTFQHEIICLDDLVPAEDLYRRLDVLVDFSFIRAGAAPYYAPEGRPLSRSDRLGQADAARGP